MIKLHLPMKYPITSGYKAKSTVWNWFYDEETKKWFNGKGCNLCKRVAHVCKCNPNELVGMHKGYDFACQEGSKVFACERGVILKLGWDGGDDFKKPNDKGFGLRIVQMVEIGNQEWLLFYGHLSFVSIKKGQAVKSGELIGLSGNTGRPSRKDYHLHCEVRDIESMQQQEIEWGAMI